MSRTTEAGEMSHSLSIVSANWPRSAQQGRGEGRGWWGLAAKTGLCTTQGKPAINVENKAPEQGELFEKCCLLTTEEESARGTEAPVGLHTTSSIVNRLGNAEFGFFPS